LTRRDLVDLVLLAALWGGSFLFMRVSVPEFGPWPLMSVRAGVALACLLPWLLWGGHLRAIAANARHMAVIGVLGTALPFVLFAWAMLVLTAGQGAIANAASPLWGALVAYLWLRERPTGWQVVGLAIGFAGVMLLVWAKASGMVGGSAVAFGAALLAAASYGVAGNYTRRYLSHVAAMANAGGSLVVATAVLAVPGLLLWPAQSPSWPAWLAVIALGVACTGFAYVVFFRLIAKVGAPRAMTVVFMVPLFGVLWGSLFLGERLDVWVAASGLTILAGTSLAAGIVKPRGRKAKDATPPPRPGPRLTPPGASSGTSGTR
jgi:drug/metabolite transporter (DMT)-like permease